jgi:hypothetical protein
MNIRLSKTHFLIICILLNATISFSQKQKKIVKNGSFYFSWGYNTEWYTHSDIHISQPALNSDYTFVNIKAHDHRGWDNHLFQTPLTIPQYNYRIGYFFNEKQTWGFEINFDHTKYVVTIGQSDHIKGKINGRDVDSTVITGNGVLYYQLNNGANFLEFNMVRKLALIDAFNSKFQFFCLLKAGVGPVIPHVQNTIFGNDNIPHFQFGGWNVDTDVSFRATFFKHVFLEYANKVVFASYSHLRIYDGLANQSFGCYEMFLVLGGTFKF